MRVLAAIAYTGAAAIALHPLRSAVTTLCVLVLLVPYLVGVGVSKGIEREAEVSLSSGADLYVSATEFGRVAAMPQNAHDFIAAMEGVEDVTPRIIGPATLGRFAVPAVVVGLPPNKLPPKVHCIQGRLFREGDMPELVLGSQLAGQLQLKVGDKIPPFYHSSQGERICQVVGIFHSDISLWQANLVFVSLETAQLIFDQPDRVTGFLVNCRAGYEESTRQQLEHSLPAALDGPSPPVRAQVVARKDLESLLSRSALHREGIFNLHFLLLFVVGILMILVTSGLGQAERRREIGILKAIGWQTDEIIVRSFVENFLLSLIGASASILISFAWLHWLNGAWIARIFLVGATVFPEFRVPFELTPVPALLAFILSSTLILTGTLVATWRAATVAPREAMR
jgi:ABC-type lipoprotein release transport system permease subunit